MLGNPFEEAAQKNWHAYDRAVERGDMERAEFCARAALRAERLAAEWRKEK